MKNNTVTVINGIRYPGDVSAAEVFVFAAIKVLPRFLRLFCPTRIFSKIQDCRCSQHYTESDAHEKPFRLLQHFSNCNTPKPRPPKRIYWIDA
jgi:hypothetical protein